MNTTVDQVYRVPHLFRAPSLLVLLGAIALDPFLLVIALVGRAGIGLGSALLFIGLSAPLLLALPLYLLYHNSGQVILTADAVVIRRWRREKRLRYDEVVAVRELDWNLPPNLVLQGAKATVGIHTQIEGFEELYQRLVQRVEVMRRRAEAEFPLVLQVTLSYQVLLIGGLVALLAFYLGIGLLPVWSELAREAPEFSAVLLRNATIWLAMISFFFLPALYIAVVGAIAGSLRGVQPVAYEFDEGTVRYRLPIGLWRSRPVTNLEAFYLKPLQRTIRVSHAGAKVTETVQLHEIVLRFAYGETLEISHDRARQFGFAPHELYARLGRLYPHVPRGELSEAQIMREPVKGAPGPLARFPHTLRLTPLALWNGLAATSFFTLCTVGSVLLHLWLILSDDPGASAKGVFWLSMAVWGAIFLALTLLVFSLTLHPRQPHKLVLTAQKIRFRYPLTPWQSWSVSELREIDLQPIAVRGVRSRGSSYVPTTIHKQVVLLRFSEERSLSIDTDRARQFGLTPAALYALLQSLYGRE
jgi:hypothetical protein